MGDVVLNVNGAAMHVHAGEGESLLSVLRNRLQLTGTKYGCGEGQCGACTVIIDGRARRSCRTIAASVEGHEIATIDGLERNENLSAVQQAFLDEEALQCGYCTSGMIMSATALLRDHVRPSDQQIIEYMNGNICRCGSYPRIVAAIKKASERIAQGSDHGR